MTAITGSTAANPTQDPAAVDEHPDCPWPDGPCVHDDPAKAHPAP
ncbi:hypothetical protein P3T36_005681 [Kitasatospora sp. MAP12-15]|nr:hypothetical protein [Kitasatospora sp. MAP12-44]MDH6113807.1 hypothetical protein [Kitasatospora sp. MAP12-44]